MQTVSYVDHVPTSEKSSRATALLPVPTGELRIAARPTPANRSIRLSLIIPTYNESKNVRELVRCLTELLEGPLNGAYELIVVDDNSPDRTWEIAQRLTAEYPKLRVMRREHERGLSTAVIRGWQAARGEVLAVIDADLQHPPEITVALWNEIDRGADLVVASRHVAGGGVSDWALHRRVFSRGAQLLGLILLPGVLGRVSDPMSGYFMVRRSAIAEKTMNPLGYKILIEVIGRGNIRWIGKVTWKLYVEYLRHLVRLRIDTLPIARFARFAAVGLSGVVVDMLLLYLLSDPSTLGWGLTRSKVLAAEVAIINNFLWNDAWTFGDVAGDQKSLTQKFKRFLKFHVICLMGVAMNVLLLNLQFNLLGMNRYLSNAIAIGLVTMWNFWLNTRLSWRVTQARRRESDVAALAGAPISTAKPANDHPVN
jgi:dolichol-phosphate mannosyltransferase